MTRKLATIREVGEIKPIENADAIEVIMIDGWQVVTRRDSHRTGEKVLFLEIDSFVPHELAPFLSGDHDPDEFNGVKGKRLKTAKLRKALSQGLVLPLSEEYTSLPIGTDLTEVLGIQLWERALDANLSGIAKGAFPLFVQKTDQNRIQNLYREFNDWKNSDIVWEITEKLDGSSLTTYYNDGDFGVCSRNIDLKEDANNSYWRAVNSNNLKEKLTSLGRNLAIQGELVGQSIQGNIYKLNGQELFVYNVYDIDQRKSLSPRERYEIVANLGLKHVPIEAYGMKLIPEITVESLLLGAEGKSTLNVNTEREGVVFKSLTTQDSFKVISNRFLLKEK